MANIQFRPSIWFRYADDTFSLLNSKETASRFLGFLNSISVFPQLKSTSFQCNNCDESINEAWGIEAYYDPSSPLCYRPNFRATRLCSFLPSYRMLAMQALQMTTGKGHSENQEETSFKMP